MLSVGIPVAALLLAMLIFQRMELGLRSAEQHVRHAVMVRSELMRVSELMSDAENGIRGYLLSRRPAYLTPFTEAPRAVVVPLSELHQLLDDRPADLERLTRVEQHVSEGLLLMQQMRSHAEDRRIPEATALLDRSQQNSQALEQELDSMRADQTLQLASWRERAKVCERRMQRALIVGSSLGLVGGFLSILALMRGVRRRLRGIQECAHRVALGQRIEAPPEGGDEITQLQRELCAAGDLLTGQAAELRAAKSDLESRVTIRTSELSNAIEKLRQANELIEAVVRSSPLAIVVLDLDGNVTFWNPGATAMFGWTDKEVLGGPVPFVPPGQEAEQREWVEKFRSGWSLNSIERRRRRKDGRLFDVAIWTAPLRDANGRIRGTVAVESDVSQQRVLEEQFRQSQKMEAIGRLAGGVSHDFNNLLTVISGYAEMLMAESHGSPRTADYVQAIQHAAARASALTGRLLTFSRRQPSRPRIINLNESVNNSVSLLRRVIGEDIEVSIHLAPDLSRVSADPGHIDQVMMNLVVNARDAMEGGGTLTIETANVWLDQDYADHHLGVQPGPYVMLAVSDTGVGMTPETRSRLFEPFFTTKEEGRGTGLGLSIVYGIVKQNNGHIVVYTEPGKGATFKIFFPAIDMPQEQPAPEPYLIAEPGAETILVCEDEASIRQLVDTMLTRQGYRVFESETPERALEILRDLELRIDLLLTDVVLPQMSGFDLVREAHAIRPEIKVIYMSGYTDRRLRRAWEPDERVPVLEKPFTAAALSKLLHDVLQPGSHLPPALHGL